MRLYLLQALVFIGSARAFLPRPIGARSSSSTRTLQRQLAEYNVEHEPDSDDDEEHGSSQQPSRLRKLFQFGKSKGRQPPVNGDRYQVPSSYMRPQHSYDDVPMRLRPDKDIANIFSQNTAWKQSKLDRDPNYFQTLGSTHRPKYMWIGCADARVPANEIMGEDAGSVFVCRNIANQVISTDFNMMAALQFAVDVLKVEHILLCGHYDCGGVRASMERKDHVPPLENWLRNIRDVYRLHRDELNFIVDPEERYRRLVELNVIEQCVNLFKTGVVQRRRLATYKKGVAFATPRIHACVFEPRTGDLVKLPVDFARYTDDLRDIYDLYSPDEQW